MPLGLLKYGLCRNQTRVGEPSAIVIRHDARQTQCYHLLGDQSYAVYMWKCLQDAMGEFGGVKLGIAAYPA